VKKGIKWEVTRTNVEGEKGRNAQQGRDKTKKTKN
jgi:hypothetical protein